MTQREGDPNFPTNLDIVPSTPGALRLGSQGRTGEAERVEDDASQDIEGFGIAGRTWEAAYLLRAYLTPPQPPASPPSFLFDPPCPLYSSTESGSAPRRRNILEIGSGTGYLSLALAPHLPPSDTLVATDLDNVCPLLEKNLAAAQARWRSQVPSAARATVLVRPLPWGDSTSLSRLLAEGLEPSIILASDLVYFQILYAPLLRTLIGLTGEREEQVTVIFSYKVRSLVKEQPFWEAFGRWFRFEAVQVGTRPSPPPSEPTSPSDTAPSAPSPPSPPHLLTWTRFGAATPSSITPNDTDELYVFICRRHPWTEHLGGEDLEDVSDDDLLQGRGAGRGVEEGAGQFEELLLNGLEWD
ncbi:putative methyltransferase-domain containing protein [Rhodotorula toruloides]|nr:putative methyltransferase-domain containing protein [Rhodotorula toruloides]